MNPKIAAVAVETYLAAAMINKGVPVSVVTKEPGGNLVLKAAVVEIQQQSTGSKFARCMFAYTASSHAVRAHARPWCTCLSRVINRARTIRSFFACVNASWDNGVRRPEMVFAEATAWAIASGRSSRRMSESKPRTTACNHRLVPIWSVYPDMKRRGLSEDSITYQRVNASPQLYATVGLVQCNSRANTRSGPSMLYPRSHSDAKRQKVR
jgi:hypothetical protein